MTKLSPNIACLGRGMPAPYAMCTKLCRQLLLPKHGPSTQDANLQADAVRLFQADYSTVNGCHKDLHNIAASAYRRERNILWNFCCKNSDRKFLAQFLHPCLSSGKAHCDSFMDTNPNSTLVCTCIASCTLHSAIAAAPSNRLDPFLVPRTSVSSDVPQAEMKAAAAASLKRKKRLKDDVCFRENGNT